MQDNPGVGGEFLNLTNDFNGEVIIPEDPEYDEARSLWNGMIDKYPDVIIKCLGTSDVIKAVKLARDNNFEIAVRGGGHNVAGTAVCDNGIVIDLSRMRGVWVDALEKTAHVQGGALWGDVDNETQLHGLATTGGVVSHTGVAGLTLGGGIGWLMRKYGLTVDNLLSVDLVTANGDLLNVSEDDHEDLFWAIRGGGGNFGIVTSFKFQLHQVGPKLLAGPVFWTEEDAVEVLKFYRDFIVECPDELCTIIRFGKIPPLPAIPENLHWKSSISISGIFTGNIDTGRNVLQSLRDHGDPLVDLISPKMYVDHQKSTDNTVLHGWHYYWKSTDLPELSDDLIEVLVTYGFSAKSPRSYSVLFQLGGAMSRVNPEVMSYSGRTSKHSININGVWKPSESNKFSEVDTEWVRQFYEALSPYYDGVYVNFLDADDTNDRVRQAYGKKKYDRLVEIKTKYDPNNIFHNNQNIEPIV